MPVYLLSFRCRLDPCIDVTLTCVSTSPWPVYQCHLDLCIDVTLTCVSMSPWPVYRHHLDLCIDIILTCVSMSPWPVYQRHLDQCIDVTLTCVSTSPWPVYWGDLDLCICFTPPCVRLSAAGPAIPIADIRGVDSMNYCKGEKMLRCKLASCYRLIDLFGWSNSIHCYITVSTATPIGPMGGLFLCLDGFWIAARYVFQHFRCEMLYLKLFV